MSTSTPGPPLDEMPGVLPMGSVFGRAEHAVVGLTEVHAYSTGCLFHFIGAAARPDPPAPPWGDPEQGLRIFAPASGHDDELLRFSIKYADGTTVSNVGESTEVVFTSFEGRGVTEEDGSRLVYRQPVWLSPTPTEGKVSLLAHWPAYGIQRATLECDSAELISAVEQVRYFWKS